MKRVKEETERKLKEDEEKRRIERDRDEAAERDRLKHTEGMEGKLSIAMGMHTLENWWTVFLMGLVD